MRVVQRDLLVMAELIFKKAHPNPTVVYAMDIDVVVREAGLLLCNSGRMYRPEAGSREAGVQLFKVGFSTYLRCQA